MHKNVVWQHYSITKEDREKVFGHRSAVVWLTGLPASGKSTIANLLEKELVSQKVYAYVLDGDNIRHGLNSDLGFSPQDRKENIRRIGEVAKLFYLSNCVVITAFISPYRADRDNVRKMVGKDFIEVYVKASVKTCEKRDPKGLYKKARQGIIKEFTGISAPYEEPLNPEIVLDTEKETPEECVKKILNFLKKEKII